MQYSGYHSIGPNDTRSITSLTENEYLKSLDFANRHQNGYTDYIPNLDNMTNNSGAQIKNTKEHRFEDLAPPMQTMESHSPSRNTTLSRMDISPERKHILPVSPKRHYKNQESPNSSLPNQVDYETFQVYLETKELLNKELNDYLLQKQKVQDV
jgi:hypothetical protein